MKFIAKKILSFLMAIAMIFTFCFFASAEDEDKPTGEIKLMSYNVDGLPIPASLSSSGRDPREATKSMIPYINEYDADILAVQEDFNYHSLLKKGINLSNSTFTSGVVPFGDGLNFYSKFPIYNVSRIGWEDAHGIFTDGSDELTPKGILYSVFKVAEGVYVDVYNIHADGYDDEGSVKARINQYKQLIELINTQSSSRPVIIIGDTNSRLCREYNQLRKLFIEQEGFRDAWSEVCDDGKYTVWESEDAACNVYGYAWWGVWDSVDRVMYRSGGGISLEAIAHEYKFFGTDKQGFYVYDSPSDHAALKVTLKYTVDEVIKDSREYKTERFNLCGRIFNGIKYFFKTISLIMSQLPALIRGEIKIEIK